MLKQRVITAVVLLLVLIAATTVLPSFYFTILISAIILLASWEWAGLIGLNSSSSKLGYLASIEVMLAACFLVLGVSPQTQGIDAERASLMLIPGLVFWLVSLVFLWGYPANSTLWNDKSKIALMGVLILLPAFVGIVSLKYLMPEGYLVLALVILVAAMDVGAYFVGVNFGSSKLAVRLSPNKSWEGVWGGVFVCLLVASGLIGLMHYYLLPLSLTEIIVLLALAVAITFFCVTGDLIESMLKRNRGVKDSAAILPGHGGILDRIDGLLAATPLFALVMMALLKSRPGG